MTRDAIPQLHEPFGPRTETRQYGDASRRFGSPLARPEMGDAIAVGRVQDWTPERLLEMVRLGAADPNALEDADVARICLAFLDLRRDLARLNDDAERHFALQAAADCENREQHEADFRMLVDSYEFQLSDDRKAAAASLAIISSENVTLRHRLAGTTPAAELVAQGRSPTLEDLLAEAVERHHPSDDVDTEIVDIPTPERTAR